MPQVIYAVGAILDLQRPREFLWPKNPAATKRVGESIIKAVKVLGHRPQIGLPAADMPENHREWLIDSDGSGHVARCRFDSIQGASVH